METEASTEASSFSKPVPLWKRRIDVSGEKPEVEKSRQVAEFTFRSSITLGSSLELKLQQRGYSETLVYLKKVELEAVYNDFTH